MPKKSGKSSASKMYSLQFLGKTIKDLQNIDPPFQKIIKAKLLILAQNPVALKNNIKRLKDKDVDFYRLLVGSYRVVFQKKEKELIVLVIRIGHRKEDPSLLFGSPNDHEGSQCDQNRRPEDMADLMAKPPVIFIEKRNIAH